jgi:hypothetical protein
LAVPFVLAAYLSERSGTVFNFGIAMESKRSISRRNRFERLEALSGRNSVSHNDHDKTVDAMAKIL